MEGGQQDLTSHQANKVRLLLLHLPGDLCQSQVTAETLHMHHQCYLTNVTFPFSNISNHSGKIFTIQ